LTRTTAILAALLLSACSAPAADLAPILAVGNIPHGKLARKMPAISDKVPERAIPHESCFVIGDSIASKGGLGGQFPQCENIARIGVPASVIAGYAARLKGKRFAYGIVSATSNDPHNRNNAGYLFDIRNSLVVKRLVWVVPTDPVAAAVVRSTAWVFSDKAVGFPGGQLHPQSYPALASAIRKVLSK
jgi:hypothetical protein